MAIFSKEEAKDIIISIVAVAIIFSYPNFHLFHVYLFVVIVSFLFHELAHRTIARKFGCAAFYKMWLAGIIFSLFFTLATNGAIRFVAPGAVVIYPFRFGRWGFRAVHLSTTEMGLIAVAGPAVNLFFAIFFRIFPGEIFQFLARINTWLALFNLIPLKPLDGSKVLEWNPAYWIFLFIISITLFFV